MDAFKLGDAVRAARKAKGLTQAELAKRVSVSRHTIMLLERNTYSDLGLRKVLNVLSVLGLSLQVITAQTQRPTLEEMYAENERERQAREASVRARRSRV